MTQPLQRRAEAFGLGGFRVMVGAGFFHGLGLGALGEIGVGESLCEGVALLLGSFGGLGQARFFGFEIDHSFDRARISMRKPHPNIGT